MAPHKMMRAAGRWGAEKKSIGYHHWNEYKAIYETRPGAGPESLDTCPFEPPGNA